MRRTEAFIVTAFTVLILFAVINNAADAVYVRFFTPQLGAPAHSAFAVAVLKLAITGLIIVIVAVGFAFIENVLTDRSSTKYAEAIGNLNRKISVIGSQLEFQREAREDAEHWFDAIGAILDAMHDAFLRTESKSVNGTMFSASLYRPEGKELRVFEYRAGDPLFEPNAPTFTFEWGQGFAGVAWETNYPQSGGRRRLLRRDPRFAEKGSNNNKARSFFATPLFMTQKEPSARYVLGLASDRARDFSWHQRQAEALHYGLQPCLSLLELCVRKYSTCMSK